MYVYVCDNNKIEVMNLKSKNEEYMGNFGGKKGKEKVA